MGKNSIYEFGETDLKYIFKFNHVFWAKIFMHKSALAIITWTAIYHLKREPFTYVEIV